MQIQNKQESVEISSLKKHPENYRDHPESQLKHIIASIKENGIYRNIVVSSDDVILAGHGVCEALKLMGQTVVPVIRVPVNSDSAKARKIIIGDNHIGNLATIDRGALTDLLHKIEDTDELLGCGFDDKIMERINSSVNIIEDIDLAPNAFSEPLSVSQIEPEKKETYTRKVTTPIYEIKGEKPDAYDVFDLRKTAQLISDIDKTVMDADLKVLLLNAASRHTIFNYEKIAELYAHSSKEIQSLMEDSALVIIDFDKAIEGGFVKLSESLKNSFDKEHSNEV